MEVLRNVLLDVEFETNKICYFRRAGAAEGRRTTGLTAHVWHREDDVRWPVDEVAGIGHADVSPCSLPRTRTRAVVQRHLEA